MTAPLVKVHETMNDYMNSAENWSLAIEIGSKVLTSHCLDLFCQKAHLQQ